MITLETKFDHVALWLMAIIVAVVSALVTLSIVNTKIGIANDCRRDPPRECIPASVSCGANNHGRCECAHYLTGDTFRFDVIETEE